MKTIYKEAICSLFCNRILLIYLDTKDRIEFSSTCKFIFEKCTRFRQSTYKIDSSDFEKTSRNNNFEVKSTEVIYNDQAEHADTIITKYKPHLVSLIWNKSESFYILENFSSSFNYLSSLHLMNMHIRQKNFKSIIENLPNLYNLVLSQIGIALRNSDQNLVKLKFSVYLKRLQMWNCYQFNYDFEDSLNIEASQVLTSTTNHHSLDMSNYSINSIKCLIWHSFCEGNINTLNELLINNLKLEKLQILTNEPFFDSLSLISNNRNLTKLIFFNVSDNALNNSYIPKLPFIKSIEINVGHFSQEFVYLLLQNCPNLEELKCFLSCREENGNIICQIIKNKKSLKKLCIVDLDLDMLLSIPFPDSNIEHLEFRNNGDVIGHFSSFVNLKQLKTIKISQGSKPLNDYDLKSQFLSNGACWRVIKYYNSIQIWKIL